VPGSLDNDGGRRCHLLPNKRWHLLSPILPNEPGTGFFIRIFTTNKSLGTDLVEYSNLYAGQNKKLMKIGRQEGNLQLSDKK
jgi:hypothetical protein